MKPRKVMVTLEMKSDRKLRLLRDKAVWQEVMNSKFAGVNNVHQATAQAVKQEK
jgi:hypothetical protein